MSSRPAPATIDTPPALVRAALDPDHRVRTEQKDTMFTGYIYTNNGASYVVTAQSAAIGAPVVLDKRNLANQAMQLWTYDSASQTFALASTQGGTPLVIDGGNGGGGRVLLQPANGQASQMWNPYVDSPYIDNVGLPNNQVLDDGFNTVGPNNPILCQPKNNPPSLNQMWTLIAASNADSFDEPVEPARSHRPNNSSSASGRSRHASANAQ